jgi:hypothetical protein
VYWARPSVVGGVDDRCFTGDGDGGIDRSGAHCSVDVDIARDLKLQTGALEFLEAAGLNGYGVGSGLKIGRCVFSRSCRGQRAGYAGRDIGDGDLSSGKDGSALIGDQTRILPW